MCVMSERIRRAVVAGAGSGGGSGWVRARIVDDGVVKPRRAELPVQRCGAKADPTELAQAPSRRRHSDSRPAMTSFLTHNSLSAPFPSLLRIPHCTPIPALYFFLGILFLRISFLCVFAPSSPWRAPPESPAQRCAERAAHAFRCSKPPACTLLSRCAGLEAHLQPVSLTSRTARTA